MRLARVALVALAFSLVSSLERSMVLLIVPAMISLNPRFRVSTIALTNLFLTPLLIIHIMPSRYSGDSLILISYFAAMSAVIFQMLTLSLLYIGKISRWAAFAIFLSGFLLAVHPEVRIFEIYRVFFFCNAIAAWYFCYAVRFGRIETGTWFHKSHYASLMLPPIWFSTFAPLPALLGNRLASRDTEDEFNFDQIQKSGIRLALRLVFPLAVGLAFFSAVAPVSILLQSVQKSFASEAVVLGTFEFRLNTLELWASAILGLVYVTARFALLFGVGVSIARMCGVPLFRGVYRPFQAKTFHDFFYRFNYYYGQMLVDLFISPAATALRRSQAKMAVALPAGVAIGVVVGGSAYHLLRWPLRLLDDPRSFFFRELKMSYYLLGLGFLVSASIVLHSKFKGSCSALGTRLPALPFFILFAALALGYRSQTVSHPEVGWKLMLRLFGIEG